MRTKGHFRDPLGYINIGKESGGCATGDGGDREHRGHMAPCAMSSNVVTFFKCCNLQKPIHSSGQLG